MDTELPEYALGILYGRCSLAVRFTEYRGSGYSPAENVAGILKNNVKYVAFGRQNKEKVQKYINLFKRKHNLVLRKVGSQTYPYKPGFGTLKRYNFELDVYEKITH